MLTKDVGQPLDATASSKNSDNCPLVQEGRRGSDKKQEASQDHLISWENYGANSPQSHLHAHKGQQEDRKNHQGSTKVKSCLTKLVVFHDLEDK